MRACTNPDGTTRTGRLSLTALVSAAVLLATGAAHAAGFTVGSIRAHAVAKTLHIEGNLDLSLTPKVEEAIGKGIPIQLTIDFRLYRRRTVIWDARVKSWTLRRELSYHALSGQYLIGDVSAVPTDRESFTALNEALTELGTLDDVTLPLDTPLSADAKYRVDVRVGIDIEALPALLRPVAYTSSDWDLNSGWTTWKVQH